MFGFFKKKFSIFGQKVRALLGKGVSAETLDELERIFYEADLGAKAAAELAERVKQLHLERPKITPDEILTEIRKELVASLDAITVHELLGPPHVVLIVGVNGNGKTTSVAKLGKHYQSQGKKVLIAAADTFRAAAIEQLQLWADRTGIDLVKGKPNSDPAAVVFDAIEAAKNRHCDVVLVDTAGRLHTKDDLMRELEKIHRVSGKAFAGSPHETLLVLDATIGQNGIEQAKTFHKFTPLTGLILTKMDGTAKGGTAIAIQRTLGLPIKFMGTGEGLDDLQPFDPQSFVDSLFD